ncbi:hypothetical protein [Metabacillus litoralis]|uniref:hypothetical protein n=1 Tax=Metabacillus litoralis TaxID=152268 RepID=UPI00204245A2|nr:hypothetical protein [Metabacillus litoralis]MCM3161520.1 hypothetical protein [Metabacillus litoralis]
MSVLFILGVMAILFMLFFKEPIINLFVINQKVINPLKRKRWFRNHWLSGLFLFFINAFLFLITGVILYALTFFTIPFLHLFVMLFAVIVSVIVWSMINFAWEGTKLTRLKMGAVGSSFYLILTIVFFYFLVRLEPLYPGEDTFMRAVGFMFAIIVTSVAFVTCFIMTGLSKRKNLNI